MARITSRNRRIIAQKCKEIFLDILDMDLSHRKDGEKIKNKACEVIRWLNTKILR